MTARGLPSALREAVARLTHDIKGRDLAGQAARLSEHYRGGADSKIVGSPAEVAAYLTARMPATYAAMGAVLDWTAEGLEDFAPASLLDIGAGPGTASWAAAEIFPTVESFTLIDRNRDLLEAARAMAQGSPRLALAKRIERDIADWDAGLSADLVLAGYALAELPEPRRARIVPLLWAAAKAVLVLVEPGTPDGYARILQAREILLGLGARIVAPCPGHYPCPIRSPDWCHFRVRLPRSRDHMRAKSASVPFEDEKFSYLAVARDGVALRASAPRILTAPQHPKQGMRLKLCADGEIAEREVWKRHKESYRALMRKDWGDTV